MLNLRTASILPLILLVACEGGTRTSSFTTTVGDGDLTTRTVEKTSADGKGRTETRTVTISDKTVTTRTETKKIYNASGNMVSENSETITTTGSLPWLDDQWDPLDDPIPSP